MEFTLSGSIVDLTTSIIALIYYLIKLCNELIPCNPPNQAASCCWEHIPGRTLFQRMSKDEDLECNLFVPCDPSLELFVPLEGLRGNRESPVDIRKLAC